MNRSEKAWARGLAALTTGHPRAVLLVVGLLSVVCLLLARGLEMRMNWLDLLPSDDPSVETYHEVQARFSDPSLVIALAGERDSLVAAAAELAPRLRALETLYNVQARLPDAFLRRHGLLLLEPRHFTRALRTYADPTLLGTLRGLNADYEREYSDSEENLRRDEIEVARGLLGLHRALELLQAHLAGAPAAAPLAEGIDALLTGEPWILSLDRRMLLILCSPVASMSAVDEILATSAAVEEVVAAVRPRHPGVTFELTGMAKISQDEMNSVGTETKLLALLAFVLIYLLLARSFRSWSMPLLALLPLLVGILWTVGLLALLFGSLNIFTVMMILLLLGLGIDFAIHLISRFHEERGRGADVRCATARMLGGTGAGVLTGGLTTAAAFYALMIADTSGVHEFGVAAGSGVVMTLLAVFLTLPALLALRERRAARVPQRAEARTAQTAEAPPMPPVRATNRAPASGGWPALGRIARASWRRPALTLALFLVLAALSLWGAYRTRFEYDFLELEPAGLTSVRLQREIPERFGTSDQVAWVIPSSVEESRALKERLRTRPSIGDVGAISDFLAPAARRAAYRPQLLAFRERLADTNTAERSPELATAAELAREIERLWDNLDLISNLAFQSGLDRIVATIDALTGYQTATDATDSTAVLPALSRLLARGPAPARVAAVSAAWPAHLRPALHALADPDSIPIAELPEQVRRAYLPRDGGAGYLLQLVPRAYLYDRTTLDRFVAQTHAIAPTTVSTAELFIVMIERTLRDGERGALLALLIILVLLLIHFRSPVGLLAMVPLLGGALFMLGLMHLLGMKYNYINLMSVPIILGIGIDDGVHALHRFREEAGSGEARIATAFRHVGRAILLTSLTTMIGFGSVGFYAMRGMASFGIVLFLGVGLCFLTTVLVLPAVLRLATRAAPRPPIQHAARSLALALVLLGAAAAPAAATPPDSAEGAAWLARIDAAERVPHAASAFTQTITTSGGSTRTLTAHSWTAAAGDLSLTLYTAPARVRGDKILIRDGGENIWYYMRRRDVTRHFAGHARRQKAMGSDFAYEDLATGDLTEDYTALREGFEELDGEPCVRLLLRPTAHGPSYDHLILWAATGDHLTRRIEYYDEEGLLKRLQLGAFAEIEERRTALRMEMVNAREGSRTVIAIETITFAAEPDPGRFTQAALPRAIEP